MLCPGACWLCATLACILGTRNVWRCGPASLLRMDSNCPQLHGWPQLLHRVEQSNEPGSCCQRCEGYKRDICDNITCWSACMMTDFAASYTTLWWLAGRM